MSVTPIFPDLLPETTYACVPDILDTFPGKKAIYVEVARAIIKMAGRKGYCSPTRKEIARRAQVGISSVYESLKWLKGHGLIEECPEPSAKSGRRFFLGWRLRGRAAPESPDGPDPVPDGRAPDNAMRAPRNAQRAPRNAQRAPRNAPLKSEGREKDVDVSSSPAPPRAPACEATAPSPEDETRRDDFLVPREEARGPTLPDQPDSEVSSIAEPIPDAGPVEPIARAEAPEPPRDPPTAEAEAPPTPEQFAAWERDAKLPKRPVGHPEWFARVAANLGLRDWHRDPDGTIVPQHPPEPERPPPAPLPSAVRAPAGQKFGSKPPSVPIDDSFPLEEGLALIRELDDPILGLTAPGRIATHFTGRYRDPKPLTYKYLVRAAKNLGTDELIGLVRLTEDQGKDRARYLAKIVKEALAFAVRCRQRRDAG